MVTKNDLRAVGVYYTFLLRLQSETTDPILFKMNSSATTAAPHTCLTDLIREVTATPCSGSADKSDVLLATLRKYHYWPALQMKKFFDKSGLVLLHNTYKRTDVSSFQKLYDECRSVVLDLNAPEGKNIVVSLANGIPERLTIDQYKEKMADTDVCELSYEGTVVFVYEHNGRWYFGTSGCPSVDSSRYFHPTMTHGQMFDEIVSKSLGLAADADSRTIRDTFTSHLDAGKTYSFILVHHKNSHVMDYSAEFEDRQYGVLFHITTRDRVTLAEDDITTAPLAHIGMKYVKRFSSASEALDGISNSYGLIVRTADGQTYKVSVPHIVSREQWDLGNPNKWLNMLHVYMQKNPNFHITDYITKYAPDLAIPTNSSGRSMAPTYIIHTVICTMRDILYSLYVQTTAYNPAFGRFKMNKEVDATLPPVLRFHLAQLRHMQTSTYAGSFLTPREVYQYLCFNQTMKNMRTLINFFASHGTYNMNFRQAECFGVLNALLTE